MSDQRTLDGEQPTHLCLQGLRIKENGRVVGLCATTHPDRVGDILSKKSLRQIVEVINKDSKIGDRRGSYRSVSLYHDWVKEGDPTKDEAGFIVPGSAKIVSLPDGHEGVEVEVEINDFYHGPMTPQEITYRIENGGIAGFSIEYDTDDKHSKNVLYAGKEYRYIDELTEFAGIGFARARMIANPHAVIYKEIEQIATEEHNMPTPEDIEKLQASLQAKEAELTQKEQALQDKEKSLQDNDAEQKSLLTKERTALDELRKDLEQKEKDLQEAKKLQVKEVLQDPAFKAAIDAELQVKSKAVKTNKEENHMGETTLSVKEMNEALAKNDHFSFKEAASTFFAENNEIFTKEMEGHGIPMKTTLQVKCDGTKLRVVGKLQVKDTLDTGTNTTSYTQAPVEFADLFVPGLVDTFNNQTNLFGALRKVPHMMGGTNYGWRIASSQQSSLAVDPDSTAVQKTPVSKIKLQTGIKEYRLGVSVSDYTLYHARASIGDLMMIEVEKSMRDVMRDINNDLFTEQGLETQNKIIGLEYVADSAGNTTLYGLTRSTTNRLAPASATDTYTAVGGATTTANIRLAMRKVEIEGASRENLRIVVNPTVRDYIFELEDGNLRYFNNSASMGFAGEIRYDGVLVIVDSSCQTDALFVIDMESAYIVVSKPPQVVGLAKVGAAEEAYVCVYLAFVYEQPRRIYMLDTLTS